MKQKIFIFLMVLGAFSVFAQSNGEQRIPQGKWVLESASAFKGNVQIPIGTENPGFEIPAEINVQHNEVTFVYKESTQKVKYEDAVMGSYLCFTACTEWKITGNKLQLQTLPDPDEETPAVITLSYYNEK